MKLINSILLILSITSLPALAQGQQNTSKGPFIDSNLEGELVQMCVLLKQDNSAKLKRAIRHSRLNRNMLKKGLVCDGLPAVTFALVNGATNTAMFIAGKGGITEKEYLAAKQARAPINEIHGE